MPYVTYTAKRSLFSDHTVDTSYTLSLNLTGLDRRQKTARTESRSMSGVSQSVVYRRDFFWSISLDDVDEDSDAFAEQLEFFESVDEFETFEFDPYGTEEIAVAKAKYILVQNYSVKRLERSMGLVFSAEFRRVDGAPALSLWRDPTALIPPAFCTPNFFDNTHWQDSNITLGAEATWTTDHWLLKGSPFGGGVGIWVLGTWATGYRPTKLKMTLKNAAQNHATTITVRVYTLNNTSVLGQTDVVFTLPEQQVQTEIALTVSEDINNINFIFDLYKDATQLLCLEFIE